MIRLHLDSFLRNGTVVATVAAAVLATSIAAATPAVAQPHVQAGFSDVSPGSHKPAIDALNELGVFEGTLCGENRFCPEDPIPRSIMAVWLIRVLENEDPADLDASRFTDVDSDESWAPYVERLAELEITVGCKKTPLQYCPDRYVSRAHMATFLVRAFDIEPADPAGFGDIAGSTHEASINALAASNITLGCTKNPLSFCPKPDRLIDPRWPPSFTAPSTSSPTAPSPPARAMRAGSGPMTPSDAGGATKRGSWTRRRAPTSPSPPAVCTLAGSSPATPSNAGETTTSVRPMPLEGQVQRHRGGRGALVRDPNP